MVIAETPQFNIGFVKWTMCDQFNLTKWDCDIWWESDSNPYYFQPNNEINLTELETKFFNRTEYQQQLQNISEYAKNLSEFQKINLSNYYNSSQIDEKVKTLMVNFSSKFVEQGDLYHEKESEGLKDSTVLIIFGCVVLAGVGVIFWLNKQQKEERFSGSYGQTPLKRPKIESKQNMQLQKEIDDLKKEVEKK